VIQDQRTMQGANAHGSPQAVRAFWADWGLLKGFVKADPSRRHELLERGDRTAAYIDGGRWVADCTACGGGMAAWPAHMQACCLDCGTVHVIDFPTPPAVKDALDVLALRPELNRHWRCDAGETVSELRRQNIQHGYPVPNAGGAGNGVD
jgi:hypothetical protein